MSDYREHFEKAVRLQVLRLLDSEDVGTQGDRALTLALQESGYPQLTRDQLKGHVYWLAEQGLVGREDHASGLFATITERGADVAQGRVRVPGVDFRRRGE